ncbi:hypothetical protein AK812_SmicGene31778 [Symbiodinium microadriaticum]|uniref:Uncharacterized protein n=1 Tax=Symbiodinium microadriaticum TaxID=2951 RepID=A0A1Q9CVV4_SYMMI|nr:hypothetical protein AK812_SmicGene31778 [Symbiodinium microadriaticum]
MDVWRTSWRVKSDDVFAAVVIGSGRTAAAALTQEQIIALMKGDPEVVDAIWEFLIGKLRRLGVDAGSRSGLAKIGEFLTGLQPDHELIGACRSRSTIIAYMASQAACRGRRGFGLNLPPTWPEDGIYEILRVQDGQVIVQQKFSREQHGISIAVLPAFQNVADLVIRQNWSEVKAAIESRTSEESKEIQSYSFGQLFQRHGSPQPLPKQVLTTTPPRMKRFKVQPDTSPEREKQLLPATKKSKVHTCSSALPPSPVIFMARCRSLGPTQLQIAFRVRRIYTLVVLLSVTTIAGHLHLVRRFYGACAKSSLSCPSDSVHGPMP